MERNPDICLSVEVVSKKFSRSLKRAVVYGAYDIGLALLRKTDHASLRKSEFWALKEVTLQLRRGRSMGVIGPNGSGKTTLMRLIAGVLAPTKGDIQVYGRIAPMLALGAGFQPVLSGRENIVLNLSLLGVAYQDTCDRLDAIVDFAEIGDAINAPIGTYSSGMVARLGFACAVHTEPQLLIVDEVLSVGDAKFRRKCRNRINDLRRAGVSMLLVSHSAVTIQTLSDECVYLREGLVAAQGSPEDVLKEYESDVLYNSTAKPTALADPSTLDQRPAHRQILKVKSIHYQADGEGHAEMLLNGRSGHIAVVIDCRESVSDVSINVMILDLTYQVGETVLFMTSHRDIGWVQLNPGQQEFRLCLPAVGLRPGMYRVKISISQGEMHDILDVVDDVRLGVRGIGASMNCLFFQPHEWMLNGLEIIGAPLPEGSEELDVIEEI